MFFFYILRHYQPLLESLNTFVCVRFTRNIYITKLLITCARSVIALQAYIIAVCRSYSRVGDGG